MIHRFVAHNRRRRRIARVLRVVEATKYLVNPVGGMVRAIVDVYKNAWKGPNAR